MELIKQIKDAEKQAKDIVEKAKQDAASLLEEAKKQRADLLKQSQQRRIKAIDEAISRAEQDGKAQADQIAETGSEAVASMQASCSQKIQSCVEKVLSHLQRA
jgi:V/A-type H+-transporting ATPase subunit G/H